MQDVLSKKESWTFFLRWQTVWKVFNTWNEQWGKMRHASYSKTLNSSSTWTVPCPHTLYFPHPENRKFNSSFCVKKITKGRIGLPNFRKSSKWKGGELYALFLLVLYIVTCPWLQMKSTSSLPRRKLSKSPNAVSPSLSLSSLFSSPIWERTSEERNKSMPALSMVRFPKVKSQANQPGLWSLGKESRALASISNE